ncbi:ImmA/IrrE family metallo-endopeptidase [Cellulosilyticum sp. WCF-2]|uniref:ImmA/IrrE family metallo-endopeptidase n=1 Tax=Cellulosilyticum sp. WCF-2 TaxID=2497860 RepID=UPI000F8E145B|nr:ImmA/IrrE family metallo-endopeptidase [Cellulosilyticum sp. WCF-2]QEH67305.1 ImmA/IrrE family metallo-endopeptidase [Cellulosilyticum sp. WCF-2]
MHQQIRQKVLKLIKKYNTSDPDKLADFLNIKIVEWDLGNQAGSYRLLKRKKVIFLNSKLSFHQRKIVLAHELGHALLHPTTNCYFIQNKTLLCSSKIEKEANIFACELLINDELLGEYIGKSINEIAAAEYLPAELLKLKLNGQKPFYF